MTENKSDHASAQTGEHQDSLEEVRFRYIGFDVYPKRVPRFWRSETEAAGYRKEAQVGSGISSLDRDFSLLHDVAMGRADRFILTVVGAVMLLTVAMPWVHFRAFGGSDFSLSWPGTLGTLLGGIGTAFGGGLTVGLSAILGLFMIIATPLLGAWILAMLWMKAPSDDIYQARLRKPLRFGYPVFFAGLVIALLSLAGGQIPGYSTWRMVDPGDSYGLGGLLTLLSYGPYAAIGAGLVAGVKSGDL